MKQSRAGLAAAATLMIAATAGCSPSTFLGDDKTTDAGGPSNDRCQEVLKPPQEQQTVSGATVMLADGSRSGYSVKTPGRHQDWARMLAGYLPQSGDNVVRAGVFGGGVDWRLKVVTPGKSSDANRSANDRQDALACFKKEMTDELGRTPDKPQTDVLNAVADASEQVKSLPGKKTIYVATDGLSNTGCADLRAADIGDASAIAGIVGSCTPEIPQLDATFTVQFIGLGNPGDGIDVKTPERVWLVSLWRQLCARTGAHCPDPKTETPDPADARQDVTPPPDADVRMPALKITPGNPTVLTVPSSILFDTDKWDVEARGQDALDQVMSFLHKMKYSRIEVRGYTDSTGTPEHNQPLSKRRAEAVLNALRSRGATGLKATGFGSRRPACSPEYKNGTPDRIAMACNRRVEIVVYS